MGFLVYILLALKASDKQKVFKDEEVDKQRMEEKEKEGKEIPMRAMMLMKGNTDDDEEVYRWLWRGLPMMKRSTDDYNEEEVNETGDQMKWRGEEGDDEDDEWKVD